jgi:hypothetical protein
VIIDLPSGNPLYPDIKSRRSRTSTAPIFVRGSFDFFAKKNLNDYLSINQYLPLTC